MGILADSTRVSASNVLLVKSLNRLSRDALVDLAKAWCQPSNQPVCAPLLGTVDAETDAQLRLASSLEELVQVYDDLLSSKANKKEVLERVLETDWKHGLSLQQLVDADFQGLEERPEHSKWGTLRVVPVPINHDEIHAAYGFGTAPMPPQIDLPSLVKGLQEELGGLVNAHYALRNMPQFSLEMLKMTVFVDDCIVRNDLCLDADGGEVVWKDLWLAVSKKASAIYLSPLSATTNTDDASYARIVLRAIPRLFSNPSHRFDLQPVSALQESLPDLMAHVGDIPKEHYEPELRLSKDIRPDPETSKKRKEMIARLRFSQ